MRSFLGIIVHLLIVKISISGTIPEEVPTQNTFEQQINIETSKESHVEDFQRWIQIQGEKTIQKIMDKISSPDDNELQTEAKIAVARYLVNVTFTAMTKRLLKYGRDLPETAFKSEYMSGQAPETGNVHQKLVVPELFYNPSTTNLQIPFPPSSQLASESEIVLTPIFVYKGADNETLIAGIPESSNDNTTGILQNRPIWQQVLSLNFSALNGGNRLPFNISFAALRPAGANTTLRLPFNISLPSGGARLPNFNLSSLTGGSREGGGPRLPFNLSLPSPGAQGGSRFPFNFSLPTPGGEGGSRLPFNFSLPTSGGEGGPRLPFNFSLPSSGNAGPRLPFNISLPNAGEGGIRLPFNLSAFGNGENNRGSGFPFNLSLPAGIGFFGSNNQNSNSSAGGVSFNFGPPEGFLVFPTPEPMNDSVRQSEVYLGNQVDMLVSGINNQNLSGVVDSTLNIANPSTVGVLVNSLLKSVLCNPVDRWNGNCGE